jgi:hypothetical protein
MTPATSNVRQHPYLQQAQFRDPVFLRIRRRVALIMLPHAERASRVQLQKLVEIYDELLGA